jgi:subtilase family serine protease
LDNFRFPRAGALALPVAIFFALGSSLAVIAQAVAARPDLRSDLTPDLHVDENRMVALAGNTPAFVRAGVDLGQVDGGMRLEKMLLVLKPAAGQQAELDSLVETLQEPGSASFHRWLSPAEFGAKFGAGDADVARVTAWLGSHGFSVDEVAAGRRVLTFSGTAAEVEEAFGAPVHRFRVGTAEHIANVRDPEVPAALAGVVAGVVSLHDVRRRAALHVVKKLDSRSFDSRGAWTLYGSHYLYPADLAAIYDAAPLYAEGTEGKGAGIAVAGRSNVLKSDVAAFRAGASLPAKAPSVVLPAADPGLVTGDQDESTLDVEWAGAMAPAAGVTLVAEGSTATTDGIDLASAYIVNHALAPVVSVSYAACEADMGAAELAFYNSLWEQAAAEGMSVFVAAGDAGAAGCDAGSATEGTRAAVNGMCSSPYATCVGGTEFDDSAKPAEYWGGTNGKGNGSALGYIPETVWNESGANGGAELWASGGGVSTVYSQPTWQAGANGMAAANGMRAVPDAALTAASHDGYAIIENGTVWIVSGTSAAAPSLASLMALVVEAQGQAQGNANPGLYALAKAAPEAFHATASGNNGVPGVEGFAAAGDAYNLATGLGSVDAAQLVAKWPITQLKPVGTPEPVGVHAGPVAGPALPQRRLRAY